MQRGIRGMDTAWNAQHSEGTRRRLRPCRSRAIKATGHRFQCNQVEPSSASRLTKSSGRHLSLETLSVQVRLARRPWRASATHHLCGSFRFEILSLRHVCVPSLARCTALFLSEAVLGYAAKQTHLAGDISRSNRPNDSVLSAFDA